MQKYFLKNGTRESGPYILDDLKYQRINSSTQVKIENGDWQLISQVKDLRFLLQLDQTGNNSYSTEKSDHQNNSSSTHVSNQQPADIAAAQKKRMVMLIALAIFLMAFGMAVSVFLAAR